MLVLRITQSSVVLKRKCHLAGRKQKLKCDIPWNIYRHRPCNDSINCIIQSFRKERPLLARILLIGRIAIALEFKNILLTIFLCC